MLMVALCLLVVGQALGAEKRCVARREMEKMKAEIVKLRKCVSPNVAFMASVKTMTTLIRRYEHQSEFKMNAKIIFDYEIIDTNRSYDKNSGVFTSPVAGIYQFDVHVAAYEFVAMFALQINGKKFSTALSDDRGSKKDWDTGSTSVTVALKKGDKVSVVCSYKKSYLDQNDDMPNLNTFSGHLIRSNDCDL